MGQPEASRGAIRQFQYFIYGSSVLCAARPKACGIDLAIDGDKSYSAQEALLATMEEISQNIQILPEKTLRDIAKGPLVQFALTSTENE